MRVLKTFTYNNNYSVESNFRRLEQDLQQVFEAFKSRIRFGDVTDGSNGENIAGQWQVVSDTGSADTEFAVAHTIGSVPTGYLVVKIDKAGIIYDSGTSWTSTNIYLKCSVANAAITLFLIK